MHQEKSGNIWLGTNSGVSKYDGKSFTHFTENEGLLNNIVLSMLQDKSGDLWFGTNGGLSKYDGKTFTNFTEKEGLINSTVWSMLQDRKGNLWFGTNGGLSKYDGKTFTNFTEKEGLINNMVLCMLQDKTGIFWFGTNDGLSKYDGKSFTHFNENNGLSNNTVLSMLQDNTGNLWFGSNGGVSKYDGKYFTHFTEKDGLGNNTVLSMLQDSVGNLWFGTRFGLSKLPKSKLGQLNDLVKQNVVNDEDIYFKNFTYSDGFLGIGCMNNSICEINDGTIWIGANDRLTLYHPLISEKNADTAAPNIQLISIDLFNENVAWVNLEKKRDTLLILGNGVEISDFEFDGLTNWYNLPENLSLTYDNNYLTFNFIGITMSQSKKVKYQYKLEGIDDNWSALTSRTEAPYGNLPHGTYTFKVKAMSSEGYWSKPFEYQFTIRPPFWQTWWFRVLLGIFIVGGVFYFTKSRELKLKKEKEILEERVELRTHQLAEKTKLAEEQKLLVEEKHKEITDSINYAERIQRSLLASKTMLDENLINYFVFFKPKDVVSGDFYWSATLNNGLFALVTADSTGHGVPGAIMSILNIACLNEAIKEGYTQPNEILNRTRKEIITVLKRDGSLEGGKDGMDASLTVYDLKNKKLTIAAANNPVWIVRLVSSSGVENKYEIIEIKPDKMPIGKHDKDSVSFTQQEIDLQRGDVVYTLTDGFPDQFGGPNGKKFMSKNLRELLAANAHLPMAEQKQLLEDTFANWIGSMEQVDDVCLIGVRV
jgi:serine phosphatase RsbU (regulator of sigma subunit)